jgi:hypothetical protein
MKYALEHGKTLNLTTANGKSTEIKISFPDGTIINTVLPSRCVFSVTAGSAFNGADFDVNILADRPVGLSD